MALATVLTTQDVGLAATCGALIPPAFVGNLSGENAEKISSRINAAVFGTALLYAVTLGGLAARDNNEQAHIQSLPEMRPDTTVVTTAKEHYCGTKRGWIEAKGQKLNCGN